MQNPASIDRLNLHMVDLASEGDIDLQIEAMKKYFDFTSSARADIIYCATINVFMQAERLKAYTKKILATYCWDYYLWAHKGQHHNWNWRAYGQFLKACDIVFVPSNAQALRLKELLDIDAVVVHTGIKHWDLKTSDGGYILDPLRYYHQDPNWDWAEKAAKELNIPFNHSEHAYSEDDFKALVANCTFMTSCVREASTGALTLMEGLYLDKSSLVSDSPYMGAKDYLGGYGWYFKHDDYNDLVAKMKWLWDTRPKMVPGQGKEFIEDNFSFELMAKKLYENLHRLVAANR